jgi:hypothetical protein
VDGRPFETINIAVSLAVAAIPEGIAHLCHGYSALGVLRTVRRTPLLKVTRRRVVGCATVVCSTRRERHAKRNDGELLIPCLSQDQVCLEMKRRRQAPFIWPTKGEWYLIRNRRKFSMPSEYCIVGAIPDGLPL